MSRSIPSVAAVQSNRIDYSHFVKVAVGGAVGDKYFTDRTAAAGTETLTYDIDGLGAVAYTIADLLVGPLDQSEQDTLGVSWLSFANLDYTWTTWANTPGLRNADVEVWRGQFDADGALLGSWKAYVGKIDGHECGDRATLALKPHATPWTRLAPSVTGKNLGAANLIPDKSKTIHWGGDRPV